jgi:type II secretory pathway pseudopilin PulG
MTPVLRSHEARSEAGFTLIEALVSMVILSFGLIAVTNLFLVGGTSNKAANHGTAATAEAVEVMERLKAIPFMTLQTSMAGQPTVGNLDANAGTLNTSSALGCGGSENCCAEPSNPPASPVPGTVPAPATSYNCVVPGNYNMIRQIPGVGRIRVRWRIAAPGAGGTDTLFLAVRAESMAPIVGGQRSRIELTTFRACTLTGCPF